MSEDFFSRHLADVPVIAILRGLPPADTVALAERCWDAGIELVEVPAQGVPGLAALEATASAAAKRGRSVGAGTVFRPQDARSARDAGAAFLVAPGLDPETVTTTREWGMPYLPGVASPTEVQLAVSLGLRTMKLFPAASLGTGWLAAMGGPFPEVRFVAVGGVTAANGREFLDVGAVGIGVGSALDTPAAVVALASIGRVPR